LEACAVADDVGGAAFAVAADTHAAASASSIPAGSQARLLRDIGLIGLEYVTRDEEVLPRMAAGPA
jgi:hypothetical protein